jgi:hypothetical protein
MKYVYTLFLLITTELYAQDSTADGKLQITGYAEVYYQYDFNKPADGNRPGFIYSHNRHNEFNLNLGYIKASANRANSRVNLALAAGTYMNANYSAEPGVLKNLFEANAGIRLSKKKQLWLDVGILPSHIGAESAVSKDCPTLTRSLIAENSPYYETGVNLSYRSTNGKWLLSALLLNGWQRITRVIGNSRMNFGTQIQYKPTERLTLNYSNFWGSDKPDSSHEKRNYHNWYGSFSISDNCLISAGFDLGIEKKPNPLSDHAHWTGGFGVIKYSFNPVWRLAWRSEYFNDPDGVLISRINNREFRVVAHSLNLDFAPDKNILLRIEGKRFTAIEPVFNKGNHFSRQNVVLAVSMAAHF